MKFLLSLMLLLSFNLFSLNQAFSQTQTQTLIKISCVQLTEDGLGQVQDKTFSVEIGQVEEGLPLISLLINSVDLTAEVKQYQFQVEGATGDISSHFVWIEKAVPEANSRNSVFNRILNIAKLSTVPPKTIEENATYKLTRQTQNVDAESPKATLVRATYTCAEPQIL